MPTSQDLNPISVIEMPEEGKATTRPMLTGELRSRPAELHSTELTMDSGHSADAPRVARHLLGVLLIVLVAGIWVGASQLIEMIFQEMAFDKPYFLTYFNTCGFAFWLLGGFCSRHMRRHLTKPLAIQPVDTVRAQGAAAPSGAWTYASIAIQVGPWWMLANYLFNVSLDHTSVASNSVLSTTSNLWTMFFSICFLGEKQNPVKYLAVMFTIGGAALVAAGDSKAHQSGNSMVGDVLSLVSAATYGTYTVLLKYQVDNSSNGESEEPLMPIVFGFIGLIVLLCGWPILILLHVTGVETFVWPSARVLGFLALNALIGTNLSDVLWARALQLTTPLVATLGLSLTIPLSLGSDMLLHGATFAPVYVCGAAIILVGFIVGSTADTLWLHFWKRYSTQSSIT